VITVEDLLIAKLVAVASKAREKDLDDLKTIFRVQSTIDYAYLETQMKSLKLEVSLAAAVVVTKELLQISKSINKDKKRENKERFR